MEILGNILAIVGFISMVFNGKPHSWGKTKSGKPVWQHIIIDIVSALIMVLGFTLAGK
ncbi:MAG: hypothetical protein PHE54_00340 [Bacilli bacterium]|nr:hypothetical protein [Bacilli bacterium]